MDVVVKETDFAKRKEAFDRVQHIIGEQQPVIYLARENLMVAVRNEFQNVRPSVLRPHVLWNSWEIYHEASGGPLAQR